MDVGQTTHAGASPHPHQMPSPVTPTAADVADQRHDERARRFFWAVLIAASAASIGGNAAHALIATDLAVPAPLAAGVAVAPPIILMASIEGLSLLARSRRVTRLTTRAAMVVPAFLAVCSFVLSFEALRDLAVHSGIPTVLAWLWPVIVDVSMAQATLALLAFWRPAERPRAADDDGRRPGLETLAEDPDEDLDMSGGDDGHAERALVVLGTRRIRQSPETVQHVLALYDAGLRVNEIATRLELHHSTVRRILGTDRGAPAHPSFTSEPISLGD